MKKAFYQIEESKRLKIIEEAMIVFSEESFDNASLNKIIKAACISKGGLFKYIDNKKDLYLFLVERVIDQLLEHQNNMINYDNDDYFYRVKSLIESGLDYYSDKPLNYRFIMNVFYDVNSSVYSDTTNLRQEKLMSFNFTSGVNFDTFRYPKKVITVTHALVEGFNIQLIKNIKAKENFSEFRSILLNEFFDSLDIIERGVEYVEL